MESGDLVKSTTITVLRTKDAVLPFVEAAQKAADANTLALGFFPAAVFGDFARREQLYVAVCSTGGFPVYVGHLLFDRRFPRANIRQMFCTPDARRLGVASRLLEELKSTLTQDGYISIYARVAEDLGDANAFWSKQGFYLQRVVDGSHARHRRIAVRVLELASPQLFPRSGLGDSERDPLGLHAQLSAELPLYLIDLNVLFDLARRRLRHQAVVNLFKAANEGLCRLAISNEIRAELQRSRTDGAFDPMVEMVDTLPEFVLGEEDCFDEIAMTALAVQVFPNQHRDGTLSANDRSDLRHLAAAIHFQLTGFITSDNAILSASAGIAANYGIQAISPDEFQLHEDDTTDVRTVLTASEASLTLRPLSAVDFEGIRALLQRSGLSSASMANGWLSPDGRGRATLQVGVWCLDKCIGYATWPKVTAGANYVVRAVVEEGHSEADNAARALLRHVIEAMINTDPCRLTLTLPNHQSRLREVAFSLGFRAAVDQVPLSKILLGHVLTASSWPKYRASLLQQLGLKLPEHPPHFRDANQDIEVIGPDGNRRHVALEVLETLLSPTLLCLPGRPAVISPIRRRFAEPLLRHSPQGSLLPAHSSSLYAARHYLSDPKTIKHLQRGALMLFYESGKGHGKQAIVAVARITESYLRRRDALTVSRAGLERSVLTADSLDEIGTSAIRAVSVIDNIFPTHNPVPLRRLEALGCGSQNQLITTKPITAQQLQCILLEAFTDG
jgi:GNAT superfamily N-acetyltransferase